MLPLLHPVLVLAVVHYAAYRRVHIRRHLDEVKPRLASNCKRLLDGNDTHLLPFVVNQPNLLVPDLLVYPQVYSACRKTTSFQKLSGKLERLFFYHPAEILERLRAEVSFLAFPH